MLFAKYLMQPLALIYHLIASEPGHEGLLIDPVLKKCLYMTCLFEELKLELVLTLETYAHADHITTAGLLQDKFQSQIAMREMTRLNLSISKFKKMKIVTDGIRLEAH